MGGGGGGSGQQSLMTNCVHATNKSGISKYYTNETFSLNLEKDGRRF